MSFSGPTPTGPHRLKPGSRLLCKQGCTPPPPPGWQPGKSLHKVTSNSACQSHAAFAMTPGSRRGPAIAPTRPVCSPPSPACGAPTSPPSWSSGFGPASAQSVASRSRGGDGVGVGGRSATQCELRCLLHCFTFTPLRHIFCSPGRRE